MKAIRWISFFALCWTLAFILANTKGCAQAGADLSKETITQSADGQTKTEKEQANIRFPKNMDSLSRFRFSRETIEIGSLSNFRVKAGGWYWMVAGLLLLILGGLLFTGTIPYVSALTGPMPIPGGIVAGVGALALVWPSIEGAVSVIVVSLLGLAAVGGVLYAVGKFSQATSTKSRAKKAKAKLDGEGKPAEGLAALRAADLAIDKALTAASKIKASLAPAPAPPPTVIAPAPAPVDRIPLG